MLKKFLMATTGVAFVALGVGKVSRAADFKVVADNLNSPRGLTFDSDGDLYVAEAGRGGTGPCIPAPGSGADGPQMCSGSTGAVTRIQNGKQERVVEDLPSLATSLPSLSASTNAFGPNDIEFDSNGKAYAVMGLGSSPEERDNVLQVPEFGQLLTFDNINGETSWTKLADLAAYEAKYNPDSDNSGFYNPYNSGIDSNPYDLQIQENTASIVDAAGNDLFEVKTDGSGLELQTVFPERPVTDPATGETIGMQSVPTAVTTGSDEALYVGELTGYPYPEDAARIFRVSSDNQPKVYADDFTQISDIAFDNQGGLYVLEYGTESILSQGYGGPGTLIYVAPDGTRTTIASEELISPSDLALGPNGNLYVSTQSFVAGQGQVVKISNPQSATTVPEPSSALGSLAFGVFGAVLWLLRKKKTASSVESHNNF